MSAPASGASAPDAISKNSTVKRMVLGAMLLCVAAVGVAAVISYVHEQIARSPDVYTSFCNVSSSVNCDRVLTSPFADLIGIPVAWLAAATYAFMGAAFAVVLYGPAHLARPGLRGACLVTYGASVFSIYMAVLSFFVLHTVCLLCSALYAITLALFVTAWVLPSRFDAAEGISDTPTLPIGVRTVAIGVSTVAVALVAWATWPDAVDGSMVHLSADEIRVRDPEFVDWYLNQPTTSLPITNRHFLGTPDAPVTIVEFFDFECGHCAGNHQRLKELLERRSHDVRIWYRHFPLDPACNESVPYQIHSRACRAAEAAECAALQGRFEQMADEMFARQQQLFESNLARIAKLAGLDIDAFNRCMSERQTLPLVLADTRAGAKLEITSTPTMFINGRRIVGMIEKPGGYDYAVTLESSLADGQLPSHPH